MQETPLFKKRQKIDKQWKKQLIIISFYCDDKAKMNRQEEQTEINGEVAH
jgi:hypothetical protein